MLHEYVISNLPQYIPNDVIYIRVLACLLSKSRLFTDLIQTMKDQTIEQTKHCSNS